MVARIRQGKHMMGALRYNELKVAAGQAECIEANQFGCEVHELTFRDKLNRLRDQAQLNRRSKTNVIHISLNFSIEDRLSKDTLSDIAAAYMEKLGFGDQPYLVYQHFDAAHPHLHILSTSIQPDGKRIPLHNIHRDKSEPARRELEAQFDLVKAEGRTRALELIHAAELPTTVYGKAETKKAITDVVSAIMRSYRYTSIAEFNAVLRRYNVQAVQGSEGSQMRQRGGLLYTILDKDHKPIGVPIKASRLAGSPTLKKLERQFALHQMMRKPFAETLRNSLDDVLKGQPVSNWKDFGDVLTKRKIELLIRQNAEGRIYGVTFIDHNTRCVFNGSDLGKAYTAKGISDRLASSPSERVADHTPPIHRDDVHPASYIESSPLVLHLGIGEILSDLAHAEQLDYSQANPLLKKKRKRKKRQL